MYYICTATNKTCFNNKTTLLFTQFQQLKSPVWERKRALLFSWPFRWVRPPLVGLPNWKHLGEVRFFGGSDVLASQRDSSSHFWLGTWAALSELCCQAKVMLLLNQTISQGAKGNFLLFVLRMLGHRNSSSVFDYTRWHCAISFSSSTFPIAGVA